MANKRMFSKQITTSDAFMEMPVSSQLLYFHLNMEADDDGFVGNPKRITKFIGAGEDDLKVLLAKRFLLAFENGVVVIKHWLLHNAVRKDMYKETQYLDQKNMLQIKDNGVYTESRNEPVTESALRLDQDRLDKKREDLPHKHLKYLSDIPPEDMKEFTIRFDASPKGIKSKAEDLKLYCEGKGKVYKNYKAFLLNALKKDFPERKIEKTIPKETEIIVTPEQLQNIKDIKKEIAKKFKL